MQSPAINLRHLLALDQISRTGRLSAAADSLALSQSALTQALRRLEAAVGCPLFERSGFGVAETGAGHVMVRRARRVTQLLIDAERDIGTLLHGPSLHRHVSASQLRALIAVVETGGYSTAARRLGISQPSVHRSVKDLGAATGIELFVRDARGIEPTESARTLARYAELVFAEIRQGFEEVRELQGATDSRIAVGSLPLARSEFLPSAVTELLKEFPDARVSILDGAYAEQLYALRCGRIDWLIGALREPRPTPDVEQARLFEQPLAVVVRPGHPLLDQGAPKMQDLADMEWIAPRQHAPARGFFDAVFENHNVDTPRRVVECSSLVATRGLLQRSDRAALMSPLQVREDVAAGELAILIDRIPNSSRAIGVTTRASWEPTLVQGRFGEILRALAAQL